MKYPKPGYSNPLTTLHIFSVQNPFTEPTQLNWPSTLTAEERIITQVVWIDETSLLVKEVDRAAVKGSVIYFDLQNGLQNGLQGRIVRHLGKDGEEGDDGWIQAEQRIMPLKDGGYLDIVPNKDGWNHIAHFARPDSSDPHWLTTGEWEVTDGISAVDEEKGLV
jgi:dipeptidyl aminopeptidase